MHTAVQSIAAIDVEGNPAAAPKSGVRAIPALIFYAAQEKEISRHEGFMDKASTSQPLLAISNHSMIDQEDA